MFWPFTSLSATASGGDELAAGKAVEVDRFFLQGGGFSLEQSSLASSSSSDLVRVFEGEGDFILF